MLDFTAGLDVFVFPLGGGMFISNGTRDDGLNQSLEVDWWNVFEDSTVVGPYSDQSTLFDNNYVTVGAGSLVVFDVWVALTD